jgi:hypothetical protein
VAAEAVQVVVVEELLPAQQFAARFTRLLVPMRCGVVRSLVLQTLLQVLSVYAVFQSLF